MFQAMVHPVIRAVDLVLWMPPPVASAWLPVMVQPVMTGEPSFMRTPAPLDAEFPVMVHPVIRAVDPVERTPPPACVARLSVMVQWVMTGDPFSTKIPAPRDGGISADDAIHDGRG